MFMALVIVVNGGELGWWIAGSAAVFTLVHELGHGFAARATGAQAEISLDFLAGYASFVPTRPLKRWERAGISLAGPAVQIGLSVAVLLLMGVNPLDSDSFGDTAASLAIWWTGPVMGLFNLVPVLPLDGGHVALAALDALIPGRSRRVMVYFSIGLTVTIGAYLFTEPRLQGLAFFVLFPLMVQLQMLSAESRRSTTKVPVAAIGEAGAWANGDVSKMSRGLVPSPWYRASQQLDQGHPDVARDVLLADFVDPEAPNWWPPDAAPTERLAALVALLPHPLPHGRAYSEQVLADVVLRLGQHETAARYAAESFRRAPSTNTALVVARAAGALGDAETAIGWLRAAFHADTNPDALESAMEHDAAFDPLRTDQRFIDLRRQLAD